MLHFDPKQEPVTPRHAATLVIVREAPGGLEVLSVLRHPKSGFLGGALVFPGGKVDPADGDDAWRERSSGVDARAEAFASDGASALALAVAASREAIEEAGILPATADGALVTELRAALASGPGGLAAALAERSLVLDTRRLVPFARWITPEAESRRFDARFFLLELPAGQEAKHDEHETTMSFWERPVKVLERAEKGEFFLAPPTARTLELLASADGVADAMAVAARQSLLPICPVFVADPAAPFLALPGDPAHPVRERRVDGPTRYVLRDGRFFAEDPPAATT